MMNSTAPTRHSGRESGGGPADVSIAGYPIRNTALVVVLCHSGEANLTISADADGWAYSQSEAARQLRRLATEIECDREGLPVDDVGDFRVSVASRPIHDVALVVAQCHDDLMALAAIPGSDGHALSVREAVRALRNLAAEIKRHPHRGTRPPRPTGDARR